MIYIKSCPVANRHGRKIMFRRENKYIANRKGHNAIHIYKAA